MTELEKQKKKEQLFQEIYVEVAKLEKDEREVMENVIK